MPIRILISRDEDPLVRNLYPVLDGVTRLTPFEIENVVRQVNPLCAQVCRNVELLIDFARVGAELGT
jgi:hypothetical protein